MIRVGIIGDIGSGKSYIAKQFDCPVFNADLEVSKLYKKNKECFINFKKKFPKYIISFPIKKTEITKAILAKPQNLKKINNIVHPAIRLKMRSFLDKNKNKKIVILDIPLLLEQKLNKKDDYLIYVEAKKKDINKRLKKRVNHNIKILKRLKKTQLPLELKKKKADFIIKNNFKGNSIKKNVKRILENILND